MAAIEQCRSAALGGHVERCEDCGHSRIAYNSCRNRHCPKCQGAAAQDWLAAREADLLPVGYFHVVFTLPAEIAPIAYQNKAVVYDLLFRTAAETLLTIAADPRHLGARIGATAVLHSWGSAMTHHPHVHMIVPGGGISLDGTRWVRCKPGFLLPVRVLSRLFRRLFLTALADAHAAGRLRFLGEIADLCRHEAFAAYLAPLRRKNWFVYAKPPFAGPQAVLAYLARYTHRAAIANSRLMTLDERGVTFGYKDYRRNGQGASGERDQPYRLKVITDSGDCDHVDHERLKPGVMVARLHAADISVLHGHGRPVSRLRSSTESMEGTRAPRSALASDGAARAGRRCGPPWAIGARAVMQRASAATRCRRKDGPLSRCDERGARCGPASRRPGWVSNDLVPAADRDLAGDQQRASIVAVVDDLEEVATLLGIERSGPQSSMISSRTRSSVVSNRGRRPSPRAWLRSPNRRPARL